MFTIVLLEPQIPPNTGSTGRLCGATNTTLHVVGKLGFELSDKTLKRAGLDYWDHINWKYFPNTENYKFEETLEDYDQYGRKVSYSVQKKGERASKAVDFFRSNPHRVQLGNLGFDLVKKNGEKVRPEDLTNIEQELNVWTGEITSRFKLEGIPVEVKTVCDQKEDIIGVEVNSELIENKQLKIRLRFPYPTGGWTDLGTQWEAEHLDFPSEISANEKNHAIVTRQMDSLNYKVGDFPISEKAAKEVFSLPMSPFLTEEQQTFIVDLL